MKNCILIIVPARLVTITELSHSVIPPLLHLEGTNDGTMSTVDESRWLLVEMLWNFSKLSSNDRAASGI